MSVNGKIEQIRPSDTDVTLSKRVLIQYGLFGNLGSGLFSYWISAFLTAFYGTVLGVPMESIALLMVVCRLFDAINDPLIGIILDKRKDKKGRGRYRVPMFIGAVLSFAITVLMFAASPSWDPTLQNVWMWAGYLIYTVCMTIFSMADRALAGVLTTNSIQRSKLSSIKGISVAISSALPGLFATSMFVYFSNDGTNVDQQGYFYTVLIWCCIGILLTAQAPWPTKEVIHQSEREKISIAKSLKCVLTTKPLLIGIIGSFVFGLVVYGRMSYMYYFCMYNCNMIELFTYITICMMIGSSLGSAVISGLFKLTKNKGMVCCIALAISAVGHLVCYGVGANGIEGKVVVFCLIFFVAVFGAGMHAAMMYAIIPDACDLVEVKHGLRIDGFASAFCSFAQKCGGAITPALASMMLANANYDSASSVQSQAVLDAISFNVLLLPGIFCVAAAVLFAFYKLNDAEHKKIVKQLEVIYAERERSVGVSVK